MLALPAMGAEPPAGVDDAPAEIACIGLHGGVFDSLASYGAEFRLRLTYISDERLVAGDCDLSAFRIVLLEHLRSDERDACRKAILDAKRANPDLRFLALGPASAQAMFDDLGNANPIETDPELARYYGSTPENLRRMLAYISDRLLGRSQDVPPPEDVSAGGLWHPDAAARFRSAAEFRAWNTGRNTLPDDAPCVAIAVHETHLAFQQPRVVAALVREFEKLDILAVAAVDMTPEYERLLLELQPAAVVHTCHSRDSVEFREKLDVPHLQSLFFRAQSIDAWLANAAAGLSPSEQAFQLTSQELLGAIEPLAAAGTTRGGGSEEDFTPIDERISHLAARAAAWVRLRKLPNSDKKIAVVYYDREMGKGELMRGSATGMFMNAPRSLVRVLHRLRDEGFGLDPVPNDENELLAWMMDHGRQIGAWAPEVLDRLAISGDAVLVPTEKYLEWFEARVPERRRQEVIERWGPAPGKFMTWGRDGRSFIVIPRIALGNVVLLPQPLRGEAHNPALVHDKATPPPHNYLATYFWLQEEFGADAAIHFGTHGSEFLLPGKASGLAGDDWPDLLLGRMPNINPWIVNNLGESTPVRRRAYAVSIDHLAPLTDAAGLSDELRNLHDDIHKWENLDEGTLREKFRQLISRQVRAARLDEDMRLPGPADRLLSASEIERVTAYLHEIENETTPTSLHTLGEPPRDEELFPYLVGCLRRPFLDALGTLIGAHAEGETDGTHDEQALKKLAAEALRLAVRNGLTPPEAIAAAAAKPVDQALPQELIDGFALAARLASGFADTHREIDGIVDALAGKFISPGPGNMPDRNQGALPTGRNLYVLNPEELPSRASWETGKLLIDRFLDERQRQTGALPKRVGFSLTPFAAYSDYGVMEAQMLYLLGVEPVWDERNVVVDVRLIPAAELKRARIDVFAAVTGYYRDLMPTRLHLLDKAVRLAASVDEPDNRVFANTQYVAAELQSRGLPTERARRLALARLFGPPPGESGSANYYYLVERSGEWDSRENLVSAYLERARYAYSKDAWGELAPEAYERQIQGTEAVLRNWSDRTRSPLSNKYDWFQGGSLALAVERLTGKRPDFILSDLRDADRPAMVDAEDALRREFRVRLFNRRWIEGMMREGYAGADQVAVHVSNAFGWKIMRPDSVSDGVWNEIVDTYVRDKRGLAVRQWFEAENPFAFQEVAEILLEAARKEYWDADAATLREVAAAYAQSVLEHGEGNGLRGGGNVRLTRFVDDVLRASGEPDARTLAEKFRSAARADVRAPGGSPNGAPPKSPSPSESAAATATQIEGRELVPVDSGDTAPSVDRPQEASQRWIGPAVAVAAAALLLLGFLTRRGTGL